MEKKKIGIDKIKAILSILSMALLTIQHFVGLFAENINVSYIPLSITFLTIFVSAMDTEGTDGIKKMSLATTILLVLSGCILYTIQNYGIHIDKNIYDAYNKVMFFLIGALSLTLSILYVKHLTKLE